MIRVGTRVYSAGTPAGEDPSYEGFTNIVCLTKSSPYGSLGPYVLRNERGQILESSYQFQKCYERVPAHREFYSRYDKTVIWDHPAEVHLIGGVPTKEMIAWRYKGLNCKYAVRYPVGREHRAKCVGAITQPNFEAYLAGEEELKFLSYLEARTAIYWTEYRNAVVKEEKFQQLRTRLSRGENLLIIEVDGPIQSSLPYYKRTYGVADNFIENGTMLCTEENLQLMLNDPVHAFGHGYCLAAALQGIELAPVRKRIKIRIKKAPTKMSDD